MTKLTIKSEELASLLKDYKESNRRNMQYTARNLFAYMAERLAEAYEQGKKDAAPQHPEQEPEARMYKAITGEWRVMLSDKLNRYIGSTTETVIPLVPMLPKEPTCGK